MGSKECAVKIITPTLGLFVVHRNHFGERYLCFWRLISIGHRRCRPKVSTLIPEVAVACAVRQVSPHCHHRAGFSEGGPSPASGQIFRCKRRRGFQVLPTCLLGVCAKVSSGFTSISVSGLRWHDSLPAFYTVLLKIRGQHITAKIKALFN